VRVARCFRIADYGSRVAKLEQAIELTRSASNRIAVILFQGIYLALKADDLSRTQVYLDKIGFLEGQWNCHEVVSAPNRATFTFDYKVDVTVSGKTVTLTKETGSKPFVRGTLHGDDYTSIQWFAADDSNDKGLDGSVATAQDTRKGECFGVHVGRAK